MLIMEIIEHTEDLEERNSVLRVQIEHLFGELHKLI
jgi:hypothetical protein